MIVDEVLGVFCVLRGCGCGKYEGDIRRRDELTGFIDKFY